MDKHLSKLIDQAAEIVANAKALLITAGAGESLSATLLALLRLLRPTEMTGQTLVANVNGDKIGHQACRAERWHAKG